MSTLIQFLTTTPNLLMSNSDLLLLYYISVNTIRRFWHQEFSFMNYDFKKGCKNEFNDNNEISCSWSKNRVSQKNDFKAVWLRNGHADSVGVNLTFFDNLTPPRQLIVARHLSTFITHSSRIGSKSQHSTDGHSSFFV